jgi:hypothetical protein
MRKPAAVPVAARKTSYPAGGADDAPTSLVCLALTLALVTLAARITSIASIW